MDDGSGHSATHDTGEEGEGITVRGEVPAGGWSTGINWNDE